MKKEIRFSAKLDTSEFDRTIDSLRKNLKDIYRGADQARLSYQNQQRASQLGISGPPTEEQRRRLEVSENRARRETDVFIKQQVRDQERLAKILEKQEEKLKKLKDLQKEKNKSTEEELKLKEKIAQTEDRISKTKEAAQKKESAISEALEMRPKFGFMQAGTRLAAIGERFGVAGVMRALPTAGKMLAGSFGGGPGIAGAALTAAGTAIEKGGELVGGYMQLPAEITASRAAGQQVSNEILRKVLSGGGYEEIFFAKQRKKAVEEAQKFTAGERLKETTSIIGNAMKTIGLGIGTGAVAGAALGGVLAIPGAIVGGAIGTGMALSKGGTKLLGVLGVGKYGEAREERYRALQQQKMRQLYEAQKELDPIRKMVMEDFQKNMMENLGFQRSAGLTDVGMREFFGDIAGRGFTRAQSRDMYQRILAAGGSTRAGLGATGAALEAERSYGLTNAAQVMGRLTGTMATGAAAEKSLVAILAAGTKQGLDSSNFAEEQRKFAEVTAQAVYAAGATDQGASAIIAERMAGLIAEKTGRGMEAVQTAAGVRSQLEKGTQGPGAALEAGMFLSDPKLRNLSPTVQAALASMDFNQISAMGPNSPLAQTIMSQTGYSWDEFLKKAQSGKELKIAGIGPEAAASASELRELGRETQVESPEVKARRTRARGELAASFIARLNVDRMTAESMVSGFEAGETDIEKLRKKAEEAQGLAPQKTGRVADQIIAQQAAMDGVVNKLQKEFGGAIDDSVGRMTKLNGAIDSLVEKIRKAAEEGDKEAMKQASDEVVGQTTAGAPNK